MAAGPSKREISRAILRKRQSSRASLTTARSHAPVFAALGDRTRLSLVVKLLDGPPRSISQLTAGTRLSRQAVTKHLRVLADVGIVHSVQVGRESRFELDPEPIENLKKYLETVSAAWDRALGRLKEFVED